MEVRQRLRLVASRAGRETGTGIMMTRPMRKNRNILRSPGGQPHPKAIVPAPEVHHADYRDWCPHCVSGMGVSHQHTSSEKEGGPSAEFSVVYTFMTEEGRVGDVEDVDEVDEAKMSTVMR